jgi:paraquat-inducible protein A
VSQLPQNLVACSECDMLQSIPAIPPGSAARCLRCGHTLAVSKLDSLERTLSLTVTAAIRAMGKHGK